MRDKNLLRKIFLTWTFLLGLSFVGASYVAAQQSAFLNEIQAFKKQDSVQMPPRQAILFVGSSSFRMWRNLQETFPEYQVINRGFGGSNLLELQHYLPDIVFPYQPKQIVIYSGENDIASSDTVTAQQVLERFKAVFEEIRAKLPQVPVVFVSIKPSPSRMKHLPVMKESNKLIKAYLKGKPRTKYVDVYKRMLDKNAQPRADIFLQDSLHMNEQGYAIWAKALKPHLLKR